MDPKKETKITKLTKQEKDVLRKTGERLVKEHETVLQRYNELEKEYSTLATELIQALDKAGQIEDDDKAMKACKEKIETTKLKMVVMKDELERLCKREKSIMEEIESINKSIKNDFDAKAGIWTTIGAWFIGVSTVVLSGYGLFSSHKAFEDGSMVDKQTRSLADRMNALFSFFNFKRG